VSVCHTILAISQRAILERPDNSASSRLVSNAACAADRRCYFDIHIQVQSEASASHYGVSGWSVRGSTTRRAPARTCSPANEPVIFTSSPIHEGCSHLLHTGRVIERRESRNERQTLVKPPGNGNAASPLWIFPLSLRPPWTWSSSARRFLSLFYHVWYFYGEL